MISLCLLCCINSAFEVPLKCLNILESDCLIFEILLEIIYMKVLIHITDLRAIVSLVKRVRLKIEG